MENGAEVVGSVVWWSEQFKADLAKFQHCKLMQSKVLHEQFDMQAYEVLTAAYVYLYGEAKGDLERAGGLMGEW